MPTATAPTSRNDRMRRARKLRSIGGLQSVADAVHGHDIPWPPRVGLQLLPEVLDVTIAGRAAPPPAPRPPGAGEPQAGAPGQGQLAPAPAAPSGRKA